MNFLFVLPWCLWLSCEVSASNPFINKWFTKGASCVDVVQFPQCRSTLAQTFKPQTAPYGTNDPATSVFLFTPKSPNKAEPLHLCGGRLPLGTTYDPKCNTEIFIHAWLDGICRTSWMREVKEQLFQRQKGCYNVILVDWTWGNSLDYFNEAVNGQIVGEQIGFVVNNIMQQTQTGPEMFHVIGHDVGAIIAAFVGKSVKGLRRITGIDPAAAAYKNVPPSQRLTYRDAQIVDIIHTNGAGCKGYGDDRAVGHADFYVNGGKSQTSCYSYLLQSLLEHNYLHGLVCLMPQICSHLQGIQYYKASINSRPCESIKSSNQTSPYWAIMGMDYEDHLPADPNVRRKYALNTADMCPYYDTKCIGNANLGGSCSFGGQNLVK